MNFIYSRYWSPSSEASTIFSTSRFSTHQDPGIYYKYVWKRINCCARCYVKNHHQKGRHTSVSVTRCLVSFKMLGCMGGHGFRFQSLMVQPALFHHCITAWLFDDFSRMVYNASWATKTLKVWEMYPNISWPSLCMTAGLLEMARRKWLWHTNRSLEDPWWAFFESTWFTFWGKIRFCWHARHLTQWCAFSFAHWLK